MVEFKDGFLIDSSTWDESIAKQVAEQEQIELSKIHWQIIYLLREFYNQTNHSPSMRALVNLCKEKLNINMNSQELYCLFPANPPLQAAKISGLPKPKHCL